MRRIFTLILGAAAVLLTGCVGFTATPAVQGKAYVVDGSMFGSSMWNCEVDGGEPICYEVTEQDRED